MAFDPKQPIHEGRFALALSQERKERGLDLAAGSVIHFNPADHPRDLLGQFKAALEGMPDGARMKLPDGTEVKKSPKGNSFYVKGDTTHGRKTGLRSGGHNVDIATQIAVGHSAQAQHPASVGGTTQHSPFDPQGLNSWVDKNHGQPGGGGGKKPPASKPPTAAGGGDKPWENWTPEESKLLDSLREVDPAAADDVRNGQATPAQKRKLVKELEDPAASYGPAGAAMAAKLKGDQPGNTGGHFADTAKGLGDVTPDPSKPKYDVKIGNAVHTVEKDGQGAVVSVGGKDTKFASHDAAVAHLKAKKEAFDHSAPALASQLAALENGKSLDLPDGTKIEKVGLRHGVGMAQKYRVHKPGEKNNRFTGEGVFLKGQEKEAAAYAAGGGGNPPKPPRPTAAGGDEPGAGGGEPVEKHGAYSIHKSGDQFEVHHSKHGAVGGAPSLQEARNLIEDSGGKLTKGTRPEDKLTPELKKEHTRLQRLTEAHWKPDIDQRWQALHDFEDKHGLPSTKLSPGGSSPAGSSGKRFEDGTEGTLVAEHIDKMKTGDSFAIGHPEGDPDWTVAKTGDSEWTVDDGSGRPMTAGSTGELLDTLGYDSSQIAETDPGTPEFEKQAGELTDYLDEQVHAFVDNTEGYEIGLPEGEDIDLSNPEHRRLLEDHMVESFSHNDLSEWEGIVSDESPDQVTLTDGTVIKLTLDGVEVSEPKQGKRD